MTASLYTDQGANVPLSAAPRSAISAWRPLWRMAKRDVRRRPGRTALVVLLLALPTAALFLASTIIRTESLTGEEYVQMTMGDAAAIAVILNPYSGDPDPQPVVLDNVGKPTVMLESWDSRITTDSKREFTRVVRGDAFHPLLAEVYLLRDGRAPRAADEGALTVRTAKDLGVTIGDTVSIRQAARSVRVVGLFDYAADAWGGRLVVATSFGLPEHFHRIPGAGVTAYYTSVDDSAGVPGATLRANEISLQATSGGGATSAITSMYVAGIVAFAVLGFIVTAAFAAGARRQLREVGLAGASGADPRHVRRALALQGTVTGVISVVVGYLLHAGALIALSAGGVQVFNHFGPRERSGTDFTMIALMTTAAATFAAWLPARGVSRVPILTALAGRRPLPEITHRQPLSGIALATIGVVLIAAVATNVNSDSDVYVAAFAAVLVLIGGALGCGWLMGRLGRLATRASGMTKLAARDASRNRARTGPLVAAIMAVTAGTLALLTILGASLREEETIAAGSDRFVTIYTWINDTDSNQHLTDGALAEATVERVDASMKFEAKLSRFTNATAEPADQIMTDTGPVWFVDPGEVRAFGLADAADALESGNGAYLTFDDETAAVESTELLRYDTESDGEAQVHARIGTETIRANSELWPQTDYVCADDSSGDKCWPSPILLVTAEIAGVDPSTLTRIATHFRLSDPLTRLQADQLRELQETFSDEALQRYIDSAPGESTVEHSLAWNFPSGLTPGTVLAIITAAGLLVALAVTAIGLTLGAVEQRDEDTALVAIGASPSDRRRLRAITTGMLSGCAVLLALPLGLIPASVAYHAGNDTWPSMPWVGVIGLTIGLPLITAAGSWLATRTPRRVDLSRIA